MYPVNTTRYNETFAQSILEKPLKPKTKKKIMMTVNMMKPQTIIVM